MKKKLLIAFFVIFIIYSCNNSNQGDVSQEFEVLDSTLIEQPLEISKETMENIIQNISSPIEMAALIKSTGAPFSQRLLSPTDYINDYNTNYKKALSLGVFGADLGYLNMYEKTGSVITHLTSIKSLANDLKLGQFFDFGMLKRLATSGGDLDSLIFISVSSFNLMDEYLRENGRTNISTLLVTGVWLEGLYLATQIVKDQPNNEIRERIGEQKLFMNDIILLLTAFKSDKNFQKLIVDLESIKVLYEDVKISYKVGEPEMIEKDGRLIIIQNEESIVEITDEQLQRIIEQTELIRSKVVNI